MDCPDYNVTFTVLDSSSAELALIKGDISDTSVPLKARTLVDAPTTLQTSTRETTTSTPKNLDLSQVPSNLFPRADITCSDKVAVISTEDVKRVFVEHFCGLWDDKQLRRDQTTAVKIELWDLGVKMYMYVGIIPIEGGWVYAMESSLCTDIFMRIVDQCTEVNLLGESC